MSNFWPWGFDHGAVALPGSPLPPIPRVQYSAIRMDHPDIIQVIFDREMTMTCDAKDQINIIIDGAAPIHPQVMEFHPTNKNILGMSVQPDFAAGQVVTWGYDDSGPCDLQEYAPPNAELDNQTFGVHNFMVDHAFDSAFGKGFK